jgi:hypothetical protein
MKKIEKFIEKIKEIEEKLNSLDYEYRELYQDFEGNEFDNQANAATEIENIILMLTHETASQIGFGINNLKLLIKYINFRKKYNKFSDYELLTLIDKNDLTIKNRIQISKGKNKTDFNKIRSNWNIEFDNIGYNKLKEKIKLL